MRLYNFLISTAKKHFESFNFNEINDRIFGSYSNKNESAFIYQIRKINYLLSGLGSKYSNLHILDLSSIQNEIGSSKMFSSTQYVTSGMVFSLEALPIIAKHCVDIISGLEGNIKKCIVLDLDNTLWGGIIGDDGIENIQLGGLGIGKAFIELQTWIKELKNRGIILAVCSKNNEDTAKLPFEKHPEMVLKLADISVFVANWENKASNIKYIQKVLNIGFDSMVFLDDNPFERNLVKEHISGICIPELPEDPALYLEYLYSLNLFETFGVSEEDGDRTLQYQIEAKRVQFQKNFVNEEDYLKSLNMVATVEGLNEFNTPRIAQLAQRSNQFNLRTIRYTENDLINFQTDKSIHPFVFHLEDKFGKHGIIGFIVLKEIAPNILFIENWFMSCRILKRGMENYILNTIVEFAKNKNYKFRL